MQTIYLNKQDDMLAVGSLSKPNELQARIPVKRPRHLRRAVWSMASCVPVGLHGAPFLKEPWPGAEMPRIKASVGDKTTQLSPRLQLGFRIFHGSRSLQSLLPRCHRMKAINSSAFCSAFSDKLIREVLGTPFGSSTPAEGTSARSLIHVPSRRSTREVH